MDKGRLEAFSDGVLAVIITIMVLSLKTPEGTDLAALKPLVHTFVSYLLSFIFIGIYWNNHHHMLQAVNKVNGKVLWANLHLLFWLSLVPFCTSWIADESFVAWPVALYGINLLFAAAAYYLLSITLVSYHGKDSVLAKAMGVGFKEWVSIFLYFAGIFMAFYSPLLAYLFYVAVAVMWFVPDKRIERLMG